MDKIKVSKEFDNGSISFKVNGRLVKLSKSTIDDMMDLIREGQFVRGDMVSVFLRYWFDSIELIAGPGGEQKEQWSTSPRLTHTPYTFPNEFIMILALLHKKDLSRLAEFVRGTEFRNSLAYRNWHRQNEGAGTFYNPDAKSKIATTIVSEAEFEQMKQEMAERDG